MQKTRHTIEVDRIIYESIASNPGLGIGAIARASGCAYETVANSLPRLLDDFRLKGEWFDATCLSLNQLFDLFL